VRLQGHAGAGALLAGAVAILEAPRRDARRVREASLWEPSADRVLTPSTQLTASTVASAPVGAPGADPGVRRREPILNVNVITL
jgi:hypothetical protein